MSRPNATWKMLRLRADMLRRLRTFFDDRGFIEVETPLLSREVIGETHIDPLPVGENSFLQASPEAHMKRLLAGETMDGATAIYQITRSFRGGERGRLHNPEFTIVEWYRIGDDMAASIDGLDQLCRAMLNRRPATRTGYADAFVRHVGVCPHTATIDELAAAAGRKGLEPLSGEIPPSRDDWLNYLLVRLVERQLGQACPTILYDYPASQAALATIRREPGRPPVAERFELYDRGVELANGYHELTDARELRQRLRKASAKRGAAGKTPLPEPTRLLAVMEAGLPACAGVALGFDRLVMLAAGAKSIDDVLSFPWEQA